MKVFLRLCIKKRISILLFSLVLSACSSEAIIETKHAVPEITQNDHVKDSLIRTGEMTAQELIRDYPKFNQSYQTFEPLPKDVEHFKKLAGMDVVVFFGLWCHDSQREVPRLIKLIEQSGNLFNSVKLIAINQKKELNKTDAEQFNVAYTPTIFVLKEQQILAQVVERPRATLVQDILGQILH